VGISDISALIAARANTDVKVKALALWYRRPPHGIFVRADSPIKTPKELEGKKLAISPGNSHQILWAGVRAALRAQAELGDVGHHGRRLDAALADQGRHRRRALLRRPRGAHPQDRQAAERRHPRVLTAWADLGLDLSSTSLVAREETIAKDADGSRHSCAPR